MEEEMSENQQYVYDAIVSQGKAYYTIIENYNKN